MYKPLLILVCIFLAVMSLSGCFGMMIFQPGECEEEIPKLPSKAEYLKERGAPASTKTVSADRDVWEYKESLWCGVIPCWGICVPLMLPVCDGFERVYFKGDRAEREHTRQSLGYGWILNVLILAGIPPTPMPVSEPACIHHAPPTKFLEFKIEPGMTVALSVGISATKHQQDKDYQEVARRLRDVLAADLVKAKFPLYNKFPIFKAVVAETQSADYAMEVSLTSVKLQFTDSFSRQFEADMAVRITDNRTNQLIVVFGVYSKTDKFTGYYSSLESVVQNAAGDILCPMIWSDDSSQRPEIQKPDKHLQAPPPPH